MREVREVTLVWDDMPDVPMGAYVAIDPNWIERSDWHGLPDDDDMITWYFLSEDEFDMARLPNNGRGFYIVECHVDGSNE